MYISTVPPKFNKAGTLKFNNMTPVTAFDNTPRAMRLALQAQRVTNGRPTVLVVNLEGLVHLAHDDKLNRLVKSTTNIQQLTRGKIGESVQHRLPIYYSPSTLGYATIYVRPRLWTRIKRWLIGQRRAGLFERSKL